MQRILNVTKSKNTKTEKNTIKWKIKTTRNLQLKSFVVTKIDAADVWVVAWKTTTILGGQNIFFKHQFFDNIWRFCISFNPTTTASSSGLHAYTCVCLAYRCGGGREAVWPIWFQPSNGFVTDVRLVLLMVFIFFFKILKANSFSIDVENHCFSFRLWEFWIFWFRNNHHKWFEGHQLV